MNAINAGDTFSVTVMLMTTDTTSFTPTVSIYTKIANGFTVDQIVSSPFTAGAIINTNLPIFSTFTVSNPYIYNTQITKGYFGNLIINFEPTLPITVANGYYMIITLTSDFYPYSNALNLPLNCQLNGVRFACTYTLAPFKITINDMYGHLTSSVNTINITTDYLAYNGIVHPAYQGRYLLNL